jgi:hypothetical protein
MVQGLKYSNNAVGKKIKIRKAKKKKKKEEEERMRVPERNLPPLVLLLSFYCPLKQHLAV